MKSYVLDTNIVVRFLMNDHVQLSGAAKALFRESTQGKVTLIWEATLVAETLFVLTSLYRQKRETAAEAVLDLINGCRLNVPNGEVVTDALTRFKTHAVDFPDALAAAIAASEKIPVASFDRDFDKFKDIQRFEPRR